MTSPSEVVPIIQSVKSPEQAERRPSLIEGSFHSCEGQIQRRSKILKRWRSEYIKVIPGMAVRLMPCVRMLAYTQINVASYRLTI